MSLHYLAACPLRTCSNLSKLLMVFVGVSKFGKTTWYSSILGLRLMINSTNCHDILLTEQLLPVMYEISGEFFIFQQDSTPAHRACETISVLELEIPAFIWPHPWLPAVHIWAWFTTEFGDKRSSGTSRRKFVTLIRINMYGVTLSRSGLNRIDPNSGVRRITPKM